MWSRAQSGRNTRPLTCISTCAAKLARARHAGACVSPHTIRRQAIRPSSAQKPTVEASIQFAWPRSRPSPRNGRFRASKSTVALPQGGQKLTSACWRWASAVVSTAATKFSLSNRWKGSTLDWSREPESPRYVQNSCPLDAHSQFSMTRHLS
jgi:hypothetical protein